MKELLACQELIIFDPYSANIKGFMYLTVMVCIGKQRCREVIEFYLL